MSTRLILCGLFFFVVSQAPPRPLLLSAHSSISITADFEGGSVGAVERKGETEFVCSLPGQADHEGRNRQVTWYYFRVDGARGREVSITLTELRGEYNYRPARIPIDGQAPPVVSTDGETWKHLPSMEHDPERGTSTIRFVPETDRVWVAHIEPYTVARLNRFLDSVRGHPHLKEETIGKTVEGRDLLLLTITDPAVPDSEKRVVWLMVRQHAWEAGTSFVGEGAIRYLLSDGPEAVQIRKRSVFKLFPMMDPDGVVHGGVRFNRNGYDVNRNWDAVNLASAEHRRLMPEIWHAKKALLGWQDSGRPIDLFLTLHNQETGGWLSGSAEFKELADLFFRSLVERTLFNPRDDAPRPPGSRPAPGRMTVVEHLQLERRLPAFILEQGIAFDSKLGRLPTSRDRLEFGRELARAMASVVLDR